MNRDAVLFDTDDSTKVDKLLLAANNAKAAAQRRLLFELARTTVDVVIDKTNGGDLSTATEHANGVTPVRINTLEQAYLQDSAGTSLIPIDIVNRVSQVKNIQRRVENVYDPKKSTFLGTVSSYPQIVRHGNIVRLQNWDGKLYTGQTLTASFDVVKWMPDYGKGISGINTQVGFPALISLGTTYIGNVTAGSFVNNLTTGGTALVVAAYASTQIGVNSAIFSTGDKVLITFPVFEDFFTVYCIDWMLYRTIQELNLFLKEDQRVVISQKMLQEAWDTVVSWNSRLEKSSDEMNLD